jgi:hypothetical protein
MPMATPIKATKLLNLLIEPIAESDLKIKSERDYRANTFADLLLAGWNLFEAGFVVTEGNIVWAADFCEALDLLLRKVFPAEGGFGDGILRKDAIQGFKAPRARETDDSLSLIPRAIIDVVNEYVKLSSRAMGISVRIRLICKE